MADTAGHDAHDFTAVVRRHVSAYVDVYYADDAASGSL